MIIAATGHRPNKLGGYTDQVKQRLLDLATAALKHYKPTHVISGMALGWDQAVALAAVNLNIPFIAAVPFKGQESQWPQSSKDDYQTLLDLAQEVIIVCPGDYSPEKMQKRNEWMVEKCEMLLALWDGSPGGTKNCIDYAKRDANPIVNLWDSWLKYKGF